MKDIKAALRIKMLQKRRMLSTEDTQKSNIAITHQVLRYPPYLRAQVLFCFVSTPWEVDTHAILRHALESGKTVGVPLCLGKGVMEVRQILSLDDLHPGPLGILEPKPDNPLLPKGIIDFALIPCLACDKQKHRLGYGGGYYDRYLKDTTFQTAALCRSAMCLNTLPYEPHDMAVDALITEDEIL